MLSPSQPGIPTFSFNSFSMFLSRASAVWLETLGPQWRPRLYFFGGIMVTIQWLLDGFGLPTLGPAPYATRFQTHMRPIGSPRSDVYTTCWWAYHLATWVNTTGSTNVPKCSWPQLDTIGETALAIVTVVAVCLWEKTLCLLTRFHVVVFFWQLHWFHRHTLTFCWNHRSCPMANCHHTTFPWFMRGILPTILGQILFIPDRSWQHWDPHPQESPHPVEEVRLVKGCEHM